MVDQRISESHMHLPGQCLDIALTPRAKYIDVALTPRILPWYIYLAEEYAKVPTQQDIYSRYDNVASLQ